jgi:hypothetical protein
VDGLRPDALESADTPHLDSLIADGSYTPYALCAIPSSTLPNHATMLTGLDVEQHGVNFNVETEGTIGVRTVHDECRDAGLRSGMFVSKPKLRYLAHEDSIDVLLVDSDGAVLVDAVIAELEGDDPLDFIFLHLRAPDSTGHDFGWMGQEYLSAVEDVDDHIARIVDALDRAGLAGAHLLITADHGGLGYTHVLNLPEVRFVPWLGWGPRFAAGRRLCETVRQPDTPATVLALLDLAVPPAYQGAVVVEALASTPQPDCQPQVPDLGTRCGVLGFPLVALLAGHGLWIWRRRGTAIR